MITIRDLGIQNYQTSWQAMLDFNVQRNTTTNDEIWLLEHPPVFTLGDAATQNDLLKPTNIPLVQTDRGGQITYHGPGQLIAYIMFDIKRAHFNVRDFVTALEIALINYLKSFGLTAKSNPHAPGVYIDQAKIASLGLRIRQGYAYHGIALNVDMDLTPFNYINPCGIANQTMTQLKAWQNDVTMQSVKNDLPQFLIKGLSV